MIMKGVKNPKIERLVWGKIKVNGQWFHQVLIIGNKIFERDTERLKKKFKTTHKIGSWEKDQLLAGDPEVILIATGWSGILKTNLKFKNRISKSGIKLREVLTGKVKREYNLLVKKGKRVNALVHTTC